ncbi:HET-domain-containing protein [Pyrenochaeta sp. DS3sAY3a]|nr:HET-domain-containing protein [Pyrenochaeta sp. DS3sAY3a]
MSSTDQISGLRLLDVDTSPLIIETFANEEAPAYAILSHTWDIEEVSYQDVLLGKAPSRKAYAKIKQACKIAAQQGLRYLWVDTCCIDKKSSAELQEAICSMYKWYKNAEVCLVYLQDYMQSSNSEPSLPSWCRWFKRGWTLQELLAPTAVKFFDCKWNELGTKRTLGHQIADITGIDLLVLRGEEDARTRTIAERMSWAAGRETSRVEDVAYSLMGLFDVFMPMLYGEGERAFIRLQEEIMKQSEDNTIFAWKGEGPEFTRGLFARRPSEFGKRLLPSNMTAPGVQHTFSQYWMPEHQSYEPPTLTSRGLLITLPLLSMGIDSPDFRVSELSLEARESSLLRFRRRGSFHWSELNDGMYLALICCINVRESEDRQLLCIPVRRHAESGVFTRTSPDTVRLLPETRASDFQMHTIYALSSKKVGER